MLGETLQDFLFTIKPYTNMLFLLILPVLLHVYFCLRKSKWAGLIMPVCYLIAVILTSISCLWMEGDPLWVLGCFCLLNMPTVGALIVYDICRRRVARKSAETEEADEGVDAEEVERAETLVSEEVPTKM